MKALTISPEPFFSPRGTPFSVYHRASVLSELGVENDILTYGRGQDVDLPGVRILRIPEFRWLGPIKVGPSMLKLFFDFFLFVSAARLIAKNRYDFVHAHEESVFFCLVLKKIFGFQMLYDMHSSLPQQLVNFKFTSSRLLIGLFERLERSSLRSAEAVITISPSLAEYALSQIQDPEKHFLIENSIFDAVHLADGIGDLQADEGLEGRIPDSRPVIAYAGTFESYQGIDLLIRAFAVLKASVTEPFLLLVGGSEQQKALYQELAVQEGIREDCLFTGQVSQRTARRLLGHAAVLTSTRTEGTNTPLKIYEYLASGTPIVATRVPSHTQVLSDQTCFLAEPHPSGLASALHAALTDSGAREARVQAAADLYRNRYSREVYSNKMRQLLKRFR